VALFRSVRTVGTARSLSLLLAVNTTVAVTPVFVRAVLDATDRSYVYDFRVHKRFRDRITQRGGRRNNGGQQPTPLRDVPTGYRC